MVGNSGRCDERRTTWVWRNLALAAGLGLALTLAADSRADDGTTTALQAASFGPAAFQPTAAQAAPAAARADMRVTLSHDDWQAQPNEGFSYRVTVTNAGDGAAEAHVETTLHPSLGNVAASAPGFSCTRHFTASGPRAGTTVVCDSHAPLGPGQSATLTIRAHGAASGEFPIAASATDDGAHAAMSHASATLQIDG